MDTDLKIFEEQVVQNYQNHMKNNELLKKFGELSTTEIADSISENCVMNYESKITNDAIDQARPGDVLVINTNNFILTGAYFLSAC